ncbi:hypothetical protein COY62_04445 [bacterium (Candidatus Howlettbacteria) CG_4_10_14_0_8_um_filter_40_9]|nr:MAG: hypothetical protein COY62_04445 [bacterium (Candidatus Howlettbacteria) CG_4_10_14_0_8_um_filter_40_9]
MSKGFWIFLTFLFFVLFFSLGVYVYAKDFIAKENAEFAISEVRDFSKCAENFNNKVGEKNEGEENR